ncbi:MAG: creatininase family protein [Planctomycetaceae bacterium]
MSPQPAEILSGERAPLAESAWRVFCYDARVSDSLPLDIVQRFLPYANWSLRMYLADLTWPQIAALPKSTPVVIPVAAVEQHGQHLPVMTDSLLLGEVVRRVEPRVAEQVLFGPLMWLGNSDHHLDFAGTLSAPPRVYLDLLLGLAENLLRHGFQRLVFLNGHGGNITPGKQAVFELRQKLRDRTDLLLLFATYWEFANPTETRSDLVQREMGHAGEWETSMILRIAPELVGEYDSLPDVSPAYSFEPAYRGWVTLERSAPGHIGVPRAASAEKGEHLLQVFSAGVAQFLQRVNRWDGHSWFWTPDPE